jgi:hypothetical protein
VVDYCILEVGFGRSRKMSPQEIKAEYDNMPEQDRPKGVQAGVTKHLAVVAGMRKLNVVRGTAADTIRQHDILSQFCEKAARRDGPSPLVRVRNDLVWDTIHGKMQHRSFSVLAAVYCIVGASERPVRITRERITAAALGYKSPKLMTPEALAQREDKALPLTVAQLRHTLDELELAGWFARVHLSPRRVYFSHRMARKEMSNELLKSSTRRMSRLAANRAADRELQAEIRTIVAAPVPSELPVSARKPPTAAEQPNPHRERAAEQPL